MKKTFKLFFVALSLIGLSSSAYSADDKTKGFDGNHAYETINSSGGNHQNESLKGFDGNH